MKSNPSAPRSSAVSSGTPTVSIGELARPYGLASHVLRHWESVGLLAPRRDAGGRRRYTEDDRVRVAVIIRGKQAGLSLEEIRAMITTPAERRAIMRAHQETLRRRIAEIQSSLDLIDAAVACAHDDFTTCPHFRRSIRGTVLLTPPSA